MTLARVSHRGCPQTIEYLRLDAQQKRLPARFHYTAEGLATDGPRNMTFTMPKDPAHVSMRAAMMSNATDQTTLCRRSRGTPGDVIRVLNLGS